MKNFIGAGAAFFGLEPEPTQFGRRRLQDLGLPEPEPPKKVAAPQHCSEPCLYLLLCRWTGPRTCWRPTCCSSWTARRPSARISADRCSAMVAGTWRHINRKYMLYWLIVNLRGYWRTDALLWPHKMRRVEQLVVFITSKFLLPEVSDNFFEILRLVELGWRPGVKNMWPENAILLRITSVFIRFLVSMLLMLLC